MDWIGGANGTILAKDGKNVTILTNSIGRAIQRIVGWTSSGILDPNDLTFSQSDANNRFLDEKSIFLRGVSGTAATLSRATFDWGVSFVPGSTTKPVSTISGWYLGIYN